MYDKYPSEAEKARRNLDDRQREQSVAIVIDAEGSVRLDYLWYKQYPVCLDAFFLAEMDTLMGMRGWRQGVKRASFKSGIPANEVLRCIAFKEAYEEVFDEVVPVDNQFEEIDMTVEVFLGLVDKKLDDKKNPWKDRYQNIATVEELITVLLVEGFSPSYQ